MTQNVYTHMAAAISCVREVAEAAHAAAVRGDPYVAPNAHITLQEHGYRITIAKVASASTASSTKSAPTSFFAVDGGRLRKPWKTRGGKHVRPADLVDAIRPGWPGIESLVHPSNFDCRKETMTNWLKECVCLGLLAKKGKNYVLGAGAAEVAR